MFGFIGGLFVGLFGIFDKVLGGGKKSDYFLDFDDAQGTGTSKTKPAEKSEPVETPQPAAVKAEPAKSEKSKSKGTAANVKKAAKEKSNKKAEPAKEEAATITAKPQTAPPTPAMTNGKVSGESEVLLFAPNYLLPKPTARRRRPGPNMGMFRQMAREMNVRR